jgi:hypothetical protein
MNFSPHRKATKLIMLPFLVGTGYQKATDSDISKIGELILLQGQDQTSNFTGICLVRIGYPSPTRKVILGVLSILTEALTANKHSLSSCHTGK